MPRVLLHLLLFCSFAVIGAPAQNIFLQLDDLQQQGQRRPDVEVKNEIEAKLAEAPELKGLSISVKVESDRIVLGGRIHNIAQKNKALAIAKASAEGREVIDDFEIIH
jgi:osmotically-inducible protein OsmY